MKNLIVNIYKTLFFFDFAIIVMYLIPDIRIKSEALLQMWREGTSLAVMIAFTYIFKKVIEKNKIKLGTNKNKFRNYSIGLLSGLSISVIPLIILRLLKVYDIEQVNKPKLIPIWLISLLLNTIVTELLLRGYLFRLYRKYYNTATVCVVISILYVSLNLNIFSKGPLYAINMLLVNLVFCLIAEYTHSILSPIIIHFVYNVVFTFLIQSNNEASKYPFIFKPSINNYIIFSGKNTGFEGSLIFLGLLVLISLFFIKRLRNQHRA